jgi:hypothetical protein
MELQLAFNRLPAQGWEMGLPTEPVTLSVAQIDELNQKLSSMRHNVNNHLALLVAALELIRRKPDLAMKMVDSMAQQPDKMNEEIQRFSAEFENAFGITRVKIEPPVGETSFLTKEV